MLVNCRCFFLNSDFATLIIRCGVRDCRILQLARENGDLRPMGSKAGAAPLPRNLDTKEPKRDSEPGKQGRIQGGVSKGALAACHSRSHRPWICKAIPPTRT